MCIHSEKFQQGIGCTEAQRSADQDTPKAVDRDISDKSENQVQKGIHCL